MTDKPKRDGRVWPRHKVDEALKMLEKGISRRMVAEYFNSSVTTMRAAFIRHGVYKPMPSHYEMKARIEAQDKLILELLRDLWDSSWPTMRKYDTFEEYRDAVLKDKKDE